MTSLLRGPALDLLVGNCRWSADMICALQIGPITEFIATAMVKSLYELDFRFHGNDRFIAQWVTGLIKRVE